MFVVMGASGRVGGAVLQALVEQGQTVRALCRRPPAESPSGVDWVAVDALDGDALALAFDGAEGAFVLNPVAPDAGDVFADAARQSASVAAALRRSGLRHAVALSSQGAHLAQGTGIVAALHGFEQALAQTEMPLTILRPAYFMESWLPMTMIGRESGVMPTLLAPLDRAIDTVSARDVGRAAAGFLLDPHPGIVNLTGPRRYAEADVTAILSRQVGKHIQAAPVPQDQIAAFHEQAGLGPSFSDQIAGMYAALNGTGIPFENAGENWSRGRTQLETVLAAV